MIGLVIITKKMEHLKMIKIQIKMPLMKMKVVMMKMKRLKKRRTMNKIMRMRLNSKPKFASRTYWKILSFGIMNFTTYKMADLYSF